MVLFMGIRLSNNKKFTKLLTVKCPKCSETLNLKVDLTLLEYNGGIAKVAVFHGSPPHSLILYIDKMGMIRGTEIADFVYLLSKKEKLTEEEYKQFENHIGVKTTATMYSAMIADIPVYILTKDDTSKPAEFMRKFLKDFPERIPILENEILEEFGISVIDLNFFKENREEVMRGLIYNLMIGDIEQDVNFNYMKSIVRKTIKKGYKGLVERYTEAKRLRLLFEKFHDDVVNSPNRVSLKELKKKYSLSNAETKYFLELFTLKKPELKYKIKDDIKLLGIF